VTVLDTSVVIDYLLADGVADQVRVLLSSTGPGAAPDLLIFEVLAVLRRATGRGEIAEGRARAALDDLGDLALDLFPTLALRHHAFDLRHNMTAGDALFVALAEILDEPLVTKDRALAAAALAHSRADVVLLGATDAG
jgi:predicted nucleic acid-binding protein